MPVNCAQVESTRIRQDKLNAKIVQQAIQYKQEPLARRVMQVDILMVTIVLPVQLGITH
jgi:hypothetical protein